MSSKLWHNHDPFLPFSQKKIGILGKKFLILRIDLDEPLYFFWCEYGCNTSTKRTFLHIRHSNGILEGIFRFKFHICIECWIWDTLCSYESLEAPLLHSLRNVCIIRRTLDKSKHGLKLLLKSWEQLGKDCIEFISLCFHKPPRVY